jgi:hypothetical protein
MSWTITPQTKVPVDPFRSQVSLLLHGNGTNGSTTITDSSPTPKTVTAVGNAQISTAQSKFGGASIAFDGSGDYLQTADTSDLKFGSGDFTVEAWVNLTVGTSSAYIVSKYTAFVSSPGIVFTILRNNHPTNPRGLFIVLGSSQVLFGSDLIADGTWYHIAMTRSDNSVRVFVNGTQAGTTFTSSTDLTDTAVLRIGASNDTDSFANGYIDDLRITKGVARYTSNFTPPAAPFPDI